MVDSSSGNAWHCFVTYVEHTTDIWGFGAFICQLIAILELAWSTNRDAGTEQKEVLSVSTGGTA